MRRALIICVLLSACRSAAPTVVHDTAPPSVAPASEIQWLVWTMSDVGPVTHRIVARGAAFEVLGSSAGAWIGVPGEPLHVRASHPYRAEDLVWEFDLEVAAVEQTDCDCAYDAEKAGLDVASCEKPLELEVGVLRPFPTGPVVYAPSPQALGSETRQIDSRIDGSVGPLAFITYCVEEYACGAAHGANSCEQHVLDLRTGSILDAYDITMEPLRGAEMLGFVREAYEDELEAADLAEEDLVFSWVAPKYEDEATPRMEEQYTGPACYACSDGLWDSYTISSRRTVDQLPPAIEQWLEETPPPPPAFLADVETTVGGWSLVPQNAELRDQLDAVFRPQ